MVFAPSMRQAIRRSFDQILNTLKITIISDTGEPIDAQNPLPVDNNSIFVGDLDIPNCDNGDFSGEITDYFDSLTSVNSDTTLNNPKQIKLWFKRTNYAHRISFGCDDPTKGFGSDITIKLLGSGGVIRYTKNFAGGDPNSFRADFGAKLFNGIIIEFNTADDVYLSNITIPKSLDVNATLLGEDNSGIVRNVKVTKDGSLTISNNSSGLSISQGNVVGMSIMSSMGEWEAGNVNPAGEDCCRWKDVGGPARLPNPAEAGEQMTIVSDNAGDNPTGIGVRAVKIHFLDATGLEQIEIITLNGTTPVNTVATDIRFINDMYSLTVGSNGVSTGNIAIYKTGSTIALTLYNLIALGGNKSLVPHRMVPFNKTLYLQNWHCSEAQDKRCIIRIRSTDMNGILIPGVFCFKDTQYLRKTVSGILSLHGTIVPALSIVKVTHWDDALGTEGSCGWWGYLEDNGA